MLYTIATAVVTLALLYRFIYAIAYRKRFRNMGFASVQDVFLVPEELQKHAGEVAKRHIISRKKRNPRWLVGRVNDNYRYIKSLYKKLNGEVKQQKSVNPASEWLLDNFYIIEEQIKDVRNTLRHGNNPLPVLKEGYLKGYPRIYALALEIVSHTDGKVDEKVISEFVTAYQSKSLLANGEIWALSLMLRVALIENIRFLCERIDETNRQWRKAEQILDSEDIFKAAKEYIKSTELNYSFVEHLIQKLRKRGRETVHVINDLRNFLVEYGITEEKIVQMEHQYQASMEVSIGNSISSLKLLSSMDWTDIFEDLSTVEQILRRDPSGVYPKMDFASRDYYRRIVEKIASIAGVSETLVALKAVECAHEAQGKEERERHVGYYLIGKGKDVLEKKGGFRAKNPCKWAMGILQHAELFYFGSIVFITLMVILALMAYAYRNMATAADVSAVVKIALVLIAISVPASEISVSTVNWLVTHIFRPRILPKLELKEGIPEEAATFIVIPTLLSDERRVKDLIFNLEKYYLANKEKNLYFALLGDFKDGPEKDMPEDEAVVKCALAGVKELNERYAKGREDIFYYFHRERQYSAGQGKWMGWERKRGALLEFNDLLLGSRQTSYRILSCDAGKLPKIKYVITLDADTELPLNAARELIGTMMHPLNKAVVDEKRGIVVDGYGLLQPRVNVDIVSANRTFFSKVFAGQWGIDPYTTAVSDVYQDLFKEGIYTGKGIYDVEVFQKVLRDAIPDNSILSHDLLEGCYVRTGLVTDIELIDGYPATYHSYAMRMHRWVRGDWQLIPWLASKVKNRKGQVISNPLSTISRWKIFDNLRRSLVSPFLMAVTVLAFGVFPGSEYVWFTFVLLTAGFPVVLEIFDIVLYGQFLMPKGKRHSAAITGIKAAFYRFGILFAFMPYQAYLMVDAIGRTLVRVFFTRKNLIEWVTAADVERRLKNGVLKSFGRMWVSILEALLVVIVDAVYSPFTWQITLPLLALWSLSPYIAYRISLVKERKMKQLSEQDKRELRLIARKTWRYFEDFVGPDDNYLPPDNYQEDPPNGVAHRTSPTNIGLLLVSTLAARDFGYISTIEMIRRLNNTISTVERMEKWKGHLFNWYNTRTLKPLRPRYVSTVDSGNLVAYMMTLKQGLLQYMREPVLDERYGRGLLDTLELLKMDNAFIGLDTSVLEDVVDSNFSVFEFKKALEELKYNIDKETIAVNSPWYRKVREMLEDYLREQKDVMPWLDDYYQILQWEGADFIVSILVDAQKDRSLIGLSRIYDKAIARIEEYEKGLTDEEVASQVVVLKDKIVKAKQQVDKAMGSIRELVNRLSRLVDDTKFEPLYVPVRQLFSIGYNVEEGQLSKAYYDLLASEARQTSYIAIARGEVDKKHWFRLGRALTVVNGYRGLVSWTGTMFEYLMPMLTMRSYENTLLDETYYFVIRAQKLYGRQRRVPWGVSESAFYSFDINLNYQYKAFGVPSLGLKRGLANEVVVAPYAAMLALPLDPEGVMQNIRMLKRHGLEGPYGFYEAVDYTSERLVQGEESKIVKSFMVHHQGMSFLALDNYFNDNIMQERFHRDPVISAAEILLQERLPEGITFKNEEKNRYESVKVVEHEEVEVIRMPRVNEGSLPDVHLLSNGSYSIMISDKGTGYSKGLGQAVTRWREDPLGNFGMFFYIQNINSNDVWSATYAPYNVMPNKYKVVFSQHKADFYRTDGNIDTHMEVIVSPSDIAEIRRLSITNHSKHSRTIEVTSYAELVIAPQAADVAHPAFGNLFVKTEYIGEYESLLAHRRPKSSDQSPVWVFHTVTVDGGEIIGDVQYETDRSKFIGRGRTLKDPVAMDVDHPLTNTVGSVLDPIMSIRRRVKIMPGQTVTIAYTTGMAESRNEALQLAEKYHDSGCIQRAFELALTRSRVESRYLNMKASEIQLYQQLVPHILFISPLRQKWSNEIRNNLKGQSVLWGYGISGDLPLVLVCIDDPEDIDIVYQMIRAHEYWRVKGLNVDLIILNEDDSSYLQPLNDMIKEAIASSHARELVGIPGGIHVIQGNNVSDDVKELFYKVARLVLRGKDGSVYDQVAVEEQRVLPDVVEWRGGKQYKQHSTTAEGLVYFNGTGGFSPDGKEYVIYLKDGNTTPLPWINVISNEEFGFQVSESGSGYTWAENSRENKLTPWYNDPVVDPPGEVLYLRDEDSGDVWTVTSQPIRDDEPYLIRHGNGYSVFEHISYGIQQELTQFVPLHDPVKVCLLKLKNLTADIRHLSLTYYMRPVMGVSEQATAPFIVTEKYEDGILLIRNTYNEDFPARIAFLDSSELSGRSYTGDRREFIGLDGSLRYPEALKRKELSGRVGAGLDPCGALQVKVMLDAGEEKTVVFMLGQCADLDAVKKLCAKYRDVNNALEELDNVKKFWDDLLDTIQVKTPDTSMDFMINRWLPYQTVGCRIWARSAFYQSGGAYGFRDQLQDAMNVVFIYPGLTRRQILTSAAHQFIEGDVQHWWHPGSGKGIRTRHSDDLLWLAYVTADYIKSTGDVDVLKVQIPYLIEEPLKEEENDRYSKPLVSTTTSTLYEHCNKAIERALRFGPHGLPLIGSGDWNDGMNTVGNKGKGESVWLGWFLYAVLMAFIPLCEVQDDRERAENYRVIAQNIVNAIEESGWDGSWYRRAYFDDGTPLGSAQNTECKIDSISQSWSVISGAAKLNRAREAMGAVEHYLVNKENGIIRLLMPPFDEGDLKPGYIKGYVPGVRENGGQYTHAAVWVVMAFALLGEGDKAWEYYNLINPINHSRTALEVSVYKVEPYVMAADVYAVQPHEGRGGWTWYTGAAGWMYRVGIEHILGLKLRGDSIVVDPCIPKGWEEYRIVYRYKNTRYFITVKNPEKVNRGVKEVLIDDKPIKDKVIRLVDDGTEHDVKVYLGECL